MPVKQTGTATPSFIFGKNRSVDHIIPDWITFLGGTLPPKVHLELGHMTGSQALNSSLQSAGSITSMHLGCKDAGMDSVVDLEHLTTFPSIFPTG